MSSFIDYLKRNKLFSILTILAMVLSYGFYATQYGAFNVDSLVMDYYNGTLLIGAGRWAATTIHLLTNWMNFSPFWHTAVMCILLYIAALIWVCLFDRVANHKIKPWALLIFAIAFVSCPIHSYQLTYPVLHIALAYGLTPLSLWFILNTEGKSFRESIPNYLLTLLCLVPAVDMYESFAAVFLVGLFGIIIIKYIIDGSFTKFSEIFKFALKCVIILAIAIGMDFIISKLLCRIFCGTFEFWYGGNTNIYWFTDKLGVLDQVLTLFVGLFSKLFIVASGSPFWLFFDACIAICIILAIYYCIKKKNFIPVLIFAGVVIATFSLDLVVGAFAAGTQMQAYLVFTSFVLLLVTTLLPNKKYLQIPVYVIIGILLFNQTKDINNYSVEWYEAYEYETDILKDMAKDLLVYDTDSKPIAFYDDEFEFPETLTRDSHPIVEANSKFWCSVWDKLLPEKLWRSICSYYDLDENSSCIQLVENGLNYYSLIICSSNAYEGRSVNSIHLAMERFGYSYSLVTEDVYEKYADFEYEETLGKHYTIVEKSDAILVYFY